MPVAFSLSIKSYFHENQATSLASDENPITHNILAQPVAVLPAATNRAARLTQLLYAHPFSFMDALQFPMHALKRPLSRIQQLSRLHSTKPTPLSGLH